MPHPGSAVDLNWYHRPGWVLVLLFFVLGPLGLPYLWRSPGFTRRVKIALTVCVIAYTGWLVAETISIVHAVQQEMKVLEPLLDR